MVLETLDSASKRNAEIYAELKGYGMSCDGHHMTAPHPEGEGAIMSMTKALSMAKMTYEDVDYINAHGTGTPLNDRMETMAIKSVFKERGKGNPCKLYKIYDRPHNGCSKRDRVGSKLPGNKKQLDSTNHKL